MPPTNSLIPFGTRKCSMVKNSSPVGLSKEAGSPARIAGGGAKAAFSALVGELRCDPRQRSGFGWIRADTYNHFDRLFGRATRQCHRDLHLRAVDGVRHDDAVRTFAVTLALHELNSGGCITPGVEDVRCQTTRSHDEEVFLAAQQSRSAHDSD